MQEVERYLHSLKVIRLQEQNKLESRLTSKTVITSIERHISEIDKQIKELEAWMNKHTRKHLRLSDQRTLITSVIGIGDLTSYTWLGELGYMDSFDDANQLESFCGLNPRKKQSGTSISGREKLSKVGNRFLRKAMYMPALTAMTYNPAIKQFADRLKAKGKPPKVVIGAVMRKLLRIIFAIVKSGRPFELNFGQGT